MSKWPKPLWVCCLRWGCAMAPSCWPTIFRDFPKCQGWRVAASAGRLGVMDKTERLFAVMDALRRHRRPVTAQQLADEQAVSVRTLYRDIQTLIGLGAPIDGEAGI